MHRLGYSYKLNIHNIVVDYSYFKYFKLTITIIIHYLRNLNSELSGHRALRDDTRYE